MRLLLHVPWRLVVQLATQFLRVGQVVLTFSALTGVIYAGQDGTSKPHAGTPSFAAVSPSVRWEGPQFLEADRKGNVFLVRGSTLDVFPVKGNQLGKPKRLDLGYPPSEPPS